MVQPVLKALSAVPGRLVMKNKAGRRQAMIFRLGRISVFFIIPTKIIGNIHRKSSKNIFYFDEI
jgi:hypothetical protein